MLSSSSLRHFPPIVDFHASLSSFSSFSHALSSPFIFRCCFSMMPDADIFWFSIIFRYARTDRRHALRAAAHAYAIAALCAATLCMQEGSKSAPCRMRVCRDAWCYASGTPFIYAPRRYVHTLRLSLQREIWWWYAAPLIFAPMPPLRARYARQRRCCLQYVYWGVFALPRDDAAGCFFSPRRWCRCRWRAPPRGCWLCLPSITPPLMLCHACRAAELRCAQPQRAPCCHDMLAHIRACAPWYATYFSLPDADDDCLTAFFMLLFAAGCLRLLSLLIRLRLSDVTMIFTMPSRFAFFAELILLRRLWRLRYCRCYAIFTVSFSSITRYHTCFRATLRFCWAPYTRAAADAACMLLIIDADDFDYLIAIYCRRCLFYFLMPPSFSLMMPSSSPLRRRWCWFSFRHCLRYIDDISSSDWFSAFAFFLLLSFFSRDIWCCFRQHASCCFRFRFLPLITPLITIWFSDAMIRLLRFFAADFFDCFSSGAAWCFIFAAAFIADVISLRFSRHDAFRFFTYAADVSILASMLMPFSHLSFFLRMPFCWFSPAITPLIFAATLMPYALFIFFAWLFWCRCRHTLAIFSSPPLIIYIFSFWWLQLPLPFSRDAASIAADFLFASSASMVSMPLIFIDWCLQLFRRYFLLAASAALDRFYSTPLTRCFTRDMLRLSRRTRARVCMPPYELPLRAHDTNTWLILLISPRAFVYVPFFCQMARHGYCWYWWFSVIIFAIIFWYASHWYAIYWYFSDCFQLSDVVDADYYFHCLPRLHFRQLPIILRHYFR